MTDLETLHDVFPAPAPPARVAEARAALLQRASRRRRRRPVLALALTAATALAVVALNLGGGGPESVPIASAEVLERAAAAAEHKPFTPPRDDQWIYMESRFGDGEMRREWRRADGAGIAYIDERGELQVEIARADPEHGRPAKLLFDGYRELAALPTDPGALLRWAYSEAENITGAGLTEHGDVYAIFNGMLRGNLLPPELEAAIFRALKRVPGVRVQALDVLGRPAYGLAQTEDWLREELLLDRETFRYLGERSTVVRDARIDPVKAGNETGRVREGSRVVLLRERTAIVDAPGERP